MPKMTCTVLIISDRFPELARGMREQAETLVLDTAAAIQRGYRQNCRVDTSAQRQSTYIVTAHASTYGLAAAAATSARPSATILPEVVRPGPYTALIAVGVSYAADNEYGVHGRAGDGAFTRAVEGQRGPFQGGLSKLLDF